MRIARYSAAATIHYGIVELAEDGGAHPDTVSELTGDPLSGPVNLTGVRTPLDDVRLLAPVLPRSKVVGVIRNYSASPVVHPAPPLVFLKPNTSVSGPDDPIVLPLASHDVRPEGELAVVIGRICRSVPEERVPEVVFGYTVANDVTAFDLIPADGPWGFAKAFDSACPLGPWIVTHLSVEEASGLAITTLWSDVAHGTGSGAKGTTDRAEEPVQHGSTRHLIHGIRQLVSAISAAMTLLPGDVILTGTPPGTVTLAPGGVVEVVIDEIGTLRNPVLADTATAA